MSESPPTFVPTFVLVGHCAPDSGMLTTTVTRHFSVARVVRVNDEDTLHAHRRRGVIWLINRIPDGRFDGDGLHIVAREARRTDAPTLVLVSNHADIQGEAEARGARQGFGKASLYAQATGEALRSAVAHARASLADTPG